MSHMILLVVVSVNGVIKVMCVMCRRHLETQVVRWQKTDSKMKSLLQVAANPILPVCLATASRTHQCPYYKHIYCLTMAFVVLLHSANHTQKHDEENSVKVESPLDANNDSITLSSDYVEQYMVPEKQREEALFEIVKEKVNSTACALSFTGSL